MPGLTLWFLVQWDGEACRFWERNWIPKSNVQGKWDAVSRLSSCTKSFSAEETPLTSMTVPHIRSASTSCSKQVHLSSTMILSLHFSFNSASTFSGQSLTYTLCSAKVSWGALKVNSESVSSENKDHIGTIFLLSLKPPQDWNLLSLLCKSPNTTFEGLGCTSIPGVLRCCWRCSHSRAARQLHVCVGKDDQQMKICLKTISDFQHNTDIVNIINFLRLLWNHFSSSPSKLFQEPWMTPVFQPKSAVSS